MSAHPVGTLLLRFIENDRHTLDSELEELSKRVPDQGSAGDGNQAAY